MHWTFEFLSDIRHLLVDTFLFQFTHPRTSDIRDKLREYNQTVDITLEKRTWVSPRILAAIFRRCFWGVASRKN